MIKIFFKEIEAGVVTETEIDANYIAELTNEYKIFTDNFKLGGTPSNTFNLKLNKDGFTNTPNAVILKENDTVIATLQVDSAEQVENDFVMLKLTDSMVNFNFAYNAKPIIDNSVSGYVTTMEILQDICSKAGIELYNDSFTNDDIQVNWYDNTITAREYIGMIAELNGGYACINDAGQLELRKFNRGSTETIDIDNCADFVLGEYHKITRIVYELGNVKYEFGADENNTLYIDSNNVFITSSSIVENIYDEINNFDFYSFETSNCPISYTSRAGDIITFSDGENNYKTIAQYSLNYFGGWIGGYSLNIGTAKQEETQQNGINTQLKNIKIKVDRDSQKITQTIERTDTLETGLSNTNNQVNTNSNNISNLNENNATMRTQLSEISHSLTDITNTVKIQGGTNIVENSVMLYGIDLYTITDTQATPGTIVSGKITDLVGKTISEAGFVIQNKKVVHDTIKGFVTGNQYTITFKYSNQENNNIKLTLHNLENEVVLNSTDPATLTEVVYTFVAKSTEISFEFESNYADDNLIALITDFIIKSGNVRSNWEPAKTEIIGTNLVIYYNGVEVTSPSQEIKMKMNNLGFEVINTNTNEVVLRATKDGIITANLTVNGIIKHTNDFTIQVLTINNDKHWMIS